jgi:ABC-type uncharacterized transport system substrate-binding protein
MGRRMPGSIQQTRRAFLSLALIALAPRARASTLPTVGILDVLDAKSSDLIRYFVPGMERLGYVEGKNIRYAFRHLDWDFSKVDPFAQELVGLAPRVLVTEAPLGVSAFLRNSSRIPIVAACSDPVGSGFTRSLSKPDRNVTGFSLNHPEILAKQIEFLRAIVPNLKRVAILGKDVAHSSVASETVRRVAAAQGVTPVPMLFRDRNDVADGLRALKRENTTAAIDLDASRSMRDDDEFARLAIASGIAIAFGGWTNEKLLLGYYVEAEEVLQAYRSRLPHLVDGVLQGAAPGDLPFELPQRYRLTINLRTAAALGLHIPERIIVGANRIIR